MLKVVQINSVCGQGSTGRICVDNSMVMTEAGIDNYVLYGTGRSSYARGRKFGSMCSLRIHQAHTRLLGWHALASSHATRALVQQLQDLKPDVIHLHNLHGFYLNIGILFEYLKKCQTPVVWTLHDCWTFTGHCAQFDYVHCSKWQTGCHNCPQLKTYPVSYVFDRSKEMWENKKRLFTSLEHMSIVTPSHWLASLVGQSFLQKYPVKVIHNGIDLGKFKPVPSDLKRKWGISNKRVVLGVVPDLAGRKGGAYFLKMAKELGEAYQVVLLGLSPKQRLPDNINGLPRTNSVDELAQIYTMADVFVNPTLEDTFPTVNLEALACGTPVVTFETGGSPESIDDFCGASVAKEDLRGLIGQVKNWANNKDREACLDAAHRFDIKKSCNQYIEQYGWTAQL